MNMKKYRVYFYMGRAANIMIELYADDWPSLETFVHEFYPNTKYDYEEVK